MCGEGGNRLVVPAGTDPETLTATVPLTWNETVAAAFAGVWKEHLEQAGRAGALPVPIASEEVNERIQLEFPEVKGTARVSAALKALGRRGRIRRLGTGSGSRARWAPADVPDSELDLSGTQAVACRSDPARVALLIQRATERLGVPAVSSRQLQDELRKDPDFQLRAASLSEAIAVACPRPGNNPSLKNPLVLRAGEVGVVPYYCLPAAAENAALYLEWLQADHAWTQLEWKALTQAARRCRLPAYAAAHLARLPSGLLETRNAISRVLDRGMVGKPTESEMRSRLQELDDIEMAWPRLFQHHHEQGPEESVPAEEIPRWTPDEFAHAIQLLTGRPPTAQEARNPLVRRVPNPAYQSKAAKDRNNSVRWHLDRTSALLFLAERHGGRMCRVLAGLARGELAFVRDPQPAIVSLRSEDPDQRLTAVACLAFLWSPESAYHLLTTTQMEPEPGVREAALWAHGFAGGPAATEVLRRHAADDSSPQVRQFARLALEAVAHEPAGWLVL